MTVASNNVVFGEGRVGLVQMISGGDLQLKESDTVVTSEDGIIIKHGDDPAENITIVPWNNVGYIRTYLTREAQNAKKVRQEERALRAARPIIDTEALKRLR